MRESSRRWLMRLLGAATVVALAVVVPLKLWKAGGADRLHAMEQQLGGLEKGNTQLEVENARLRREADRLANDLDAVGNVARDDLGMVKPGEVVFQLEKK